MPFMFYLYKIALSDGRAYIGVSKDPNKRFVEHCRSRYSIGQAIREVGKNASLQVLVGGAADYIFPLEEKAIATFNTRWPSGLNVAIGGFGGRDHLPITRAKISANCLGKKKSTEARANMSAARLGKSPSLSTREKLAIINRGKTMPSEVKAKISSALVGRAKPAGFGAHLAAVNLGKHHTLAARTRMSASKTGVPWSVARRAAYEAHHGV